MSRTVQARLTAGFLITVGAIALAVSAASAWPRPATDVTGGTCTSQGVRAPIIWTVHNRETGHDGSPATIIDVATSPVFPTTGAGRVLLNTGDSTAQLVTSVPAAFHGPVTLSYLLSWSGTAGSDVRPGAATVNVVACPVSVPPPTSICGIYGTSTTIPACPTSTSTSTTPPPCTVTCTPPPTRLPPCGPPPSTVTPTTVHPPLCVPPPTSSTTPTTAPPPSTTPPPPVTTPTTICTTTTTEAPTTSTTKATTSTTAATTTTEAPTTTTSTIPDTLPPPPPSSSTSSSTTTSTTVVPPETTPPTSETPPPPPVDSTPPPPPPGPSLVAIPHPTVPVVAETLPVTGTDSVPLALGGVLLVGFGAWIVRRSNQLADA